MFTQKYTARIDHTISFIGLCDISIISFIAIFSLLSQYDVSLFVIMIIATEIVKGYV